jgi:hypothetical protein
LDHTHSHKIKEGKLDVKCHGKQMGSLRKAKKWLFIKGTKRKEPISSEEILKQPFFRNPTLWMKRTKCHLDYATLMD